MKHDQLVDQCIRLQCALLRFVTPSLVSVSFDVGDDDNTTVRIAYWASAPQRERENIRDLEGRIHEVFSGRANTEVVFCSDLEALQPLQWPIFRIRMNSDC